MGDRVSDRPNEMVEGSFVYWMDLDETVQRGDLGIVGISWECDAGERKVHFPDWEGGGYV